MPLGFKRGIGEIHATRGLWVHPGYPSCNIPRIWSVFSCGESNTQKVAAAKIVCYPQHPRGGSRCHGSQDHVGKQRGPSGGGQSLGKAWTRAFIVTLAERGEAGKQLSRFRIRSFEKCLQARGKGAGAKSSGSWPFCCCFLVAKSCPSFYGPCTAAR